MIRIETTDEDREVSDTIRCDKYVLVAWNGNSVERSASVVYANDTELVEPSLEVALETIAKALATSEIQHAALVGSLALASMKYSRQE